MKINKNYLWSSKYNQLISRNIGLVSYEQQEKIKETPIAILGVGGLGGPIAEQLVRSGCENIIICDNEKFDYTNLNRQIVRLDDIGKEKVKVTKNLLININPEVHIRTFTSITPTNIKKIFDGVKIGTLTLDDPFALIMITRWCRNKNIDLIESYGMPVLWAWWITEDSTDYEEVYDLNTHKFSLEDLKKKSDLNVLFHNSVVNKIGHLPGIPTLYNQEEGAWERLSSGASPFFTMAPFVRLTASYMAYEIIFSGILGVKHKILAPQIKGFDYVHMRVIHTSV